jgi:hypothetical protein
MGAQQDSDSRRISPGAPDHPDARGRGFACQVAMGFCLALIGWCVPAMWWGFAPSGFALLMLVVFPVLFPAGFVCLVSYGRWLDSLSEQPKGTLAPRFQFNIKHLFWLVIVTGVVCALIVFALRNLSAE